ncbi:hypothetical protein [Deinococcus malanensis]|nr:hypothetical protein [Deinococcus malanensis]
MKADTPAGAEAVRVLDELNIGHTQYALHLRYIARWGSERRRLLANGANFQLMEGLGREEAKGLLVGLDLSGTKVQQRRQLSAHLYEKAQVPAEKGWLSPAATTGRKVRVYDPRQVVWVYPAEEVDFLEGLHPYVARSLIARYVPSAGVVADPMAGDGVVPMMATELGHVAWASDIEPSKPYIAELDLRTNDLGELFGERNQTVADLLVAHPPTPGGLEKTLDQYAEWLTEILGHCWGAIKAGGHLALIVPIQGELAILAAMEHVLLESAIEVFALDDAKLRAVHIAAARNGSEGWHILVFQVPTFGEGE